jgi:hypothetical protein
MFATLRRTWELAKQSFAVLRADKEILLFPVMSAVAAILVSISFLVPLLQSGALQSLTEGEAKPGLYAVLFVFYYLNYFVIIFFNSALVACANIRLSGGDPTVGDGLRTAAGRIGRIAVWALVAATVGLLLRALEERFEKLGQLVISLIGLAWTLITYFVVPVIIFEDLSIFDSIKRSAQLFRRQWGEQVVGGFSFGVLFFLMAIPGFLLAFVGFNIHPLAGVALGVIYFVVLAAVASAVKGIFVVALYRYATKGEVPAGFSPELVQSAFRPRPGRS